jgi:hypothetical protein
MPQQSATSSREKSQRQRSGSWFQRKMRRLRDSKRKQKHLQQLVVIIVAVLIAFVLGYFFFGPSFSSGE